MKASIAQKAKQLIDKNLYMTISVADETGHPWIANLYYAFDKNYNFYWYSSKKTLHSRYIRKNPQIAIAIFDSTAVGDNVDAVYIKAKAYEVSDKKELLKGLLCYGKKLLRTKFISGKDMFDKFIKSYKDFQGKSVLRMYKAEPVKFWKLASSKIFNDKFVDSRLEVKLK